MRVPGRGGIHGWKERWRLGEIQGGEGLGVAAGELQRHTEEERREGETMAGKADDHGGRGMEGGRREGDETMSAMEEGSTGWAMLATRTGGHVAYLGTTAGKQNA